MNLKIHFFYENQIRLHQLEIGMIFYKKFNRFRTDTNYPQIIKKVKIYWIVSFCWNKIKNQKNISILA